MSREEYLGDGLYVSFDGWQFCLRAPRESGEDHVVYLEDSLLRNFMDYVKRTKESYAEAAYERQQEQLMENGPGPSLLDQQRDALKFK